jgi:putative ABC transport system permease protein
MHAWREDLRYAVRTLARSRTFTLVATLTLAVGIGANAAIFSLLDEALFQRLPVERPDELRAAVVVSRTGERLSNVPAELFQELRQAPRSFSGVFACWRTELSLDAGGDVERVLVQYASGRYYSTLGVPMFLGRPIEDADEHGAGTVAVLSHRFWVRRFGADRSVLGRTLGLNGVPATVIGVTPPLFFGIDRGVSPDVTVPLPNPSPFANLWVTVRLEPGASEREAETESTMALQRALETIRPRLSRYRQSDRERILTLRAALDPAARGAGAAMRTYVEPLWLLILLSTSVLFIACVNVANLMLARTQARREEYAVRLALGAGRRRLVQQVLAESLLLTSLGSVAGLTLALFIHRSLVRLLMNDLAHQALSFSLNAHVLVFTSLITATTVVIVGLTPAWRATRVELRESLRSAVGSARGPRRLLARGFLAGQVAATLILVLAAGLLLRSFGNLVSIDTGVPADRMLTLRIALGPRESGRREPVRVYTDIVNQVQTIPGVARAALGWDFALASGGANKSIWVEGQPPDQSQSTGFNVVGPGFFATAGIPVVLGREFAASDDGSARKVVVVNEAWVRRYSPSGSPIGLHLGDEGAGSVGKYEVVGVVRDTRTMSLRTPPAPMLYQPLLQDEWASSVVLHVRTAGNPWAVKDRVRAAIRGLNPRLPVYDLTTLGDRRSLGLSRDRMMATLSACFAAAALILTILGMYGVIAYSVARRTAEVGLRIALGATPAGIHWLIARDVLATIALGVGAGIPLARAGARIIQSMLFGVTAGDPIVLLLSVSAVLAGGALGGYLPSRRAARLEPAAALRAE